MKDKISEYEYSVLNVRVPNEISKWLDSVIKDGMYSNKSEAIRSFVRDYIMKSKENKKD